MCRSLSWTPPSVWKPATHTRFVPCVTRQVRYQSTLFEAPFFNNRKWLIFVLSEVWSGWTNGEVIYEIDTSNGELTEWTEKKHFWSLLQSFQWPHENPIQIRVSLVSIISRSAFYKWVPSSRKSPFHNYFHHAQSFLVNFDSDRIWIRFDHETTDELIYCLRPIGFPIHFSVGICFLSCCSFLLMISSRLS